SRVVAPFPPPPPSITNLNPTTGTPNTSVTITGTNFGTGQGTSAVTFNNRPSTPSSWANSSISAPVPAGATTGPVVVVVGGASSNTDKIFTVIPPPTVTTVAPSSAHRGDPVTIAGTGFQATQGASTVTFHGSAAAPTSWSDTSISTTVPA